MPDAATWPEVVGWMGNAFYFTRFLIQWIHSERAGESVAPTLFWWFSVCGAASLGSYAYWIGDTPLVLGYTITFVIYVRNLTIVHLGARAGRLGFVPTLGLALAAAAVLIYLAAGREVEDQAQRAWIAVGFVGQAVFSSRFVVQWYASERRGDAHFTRAFWWLSLVGNVLLLAYVIHRGDLVFIAGFFLGPFVQVRNLMLSRAKV